MQTMIGQLARLQDHEEVLTTRSVLGRLTYHPPAAASACDALALAAANIHRLFRYLEAEQYYLDIRLPKASERRRNFLEIQVQPRLSCKSVASQLRELERAANTCNPLVWEAAWRGMTMPALRVLDQAQTEAMADKRNPLKLRVDFWSDGQILSSPIATADYVTKLLPIAKRIAGRSGNPGRDAEDATIKSLCALFRTLTGHDAEVRRGGHPDFGQKQWQRARGSAVIFILWLMFCFRLLLVESGAYSTWRRAVLGRAREAAKAADRKKTGNVGTTAPER